MRLAKFRSALAGLDVAVSEVRGRAGLPSIVSGSRPHSRTGLSVDELVHAHFFGNREHINFTSLLETCSLLGGRPARILETGSSAWGTNSTVLWDTYVQCFGGEVWSVDIRSSPSRRLRRQVSAGTRLVIDDSARFLQSWSRSHPDHHVDLVYLDSWDLSADDPIPSAVHCMKEFRAIQSHLCNGSLLLVDDTPCSDEWLTPGLRLAASEHFRRTGRWPGKGMLLDLYLANHPRVTKVHHRYQVLYRFE